MLKNATKILKQQIHLDILDKRVFLVRILARLDAHCLSFMIGVYVEQYVSKYKTT